MSTVDEKMLEKTLLNVLKTGKYNLGLKESTKSLKSVKLLVYASTLAEKTLSDLERSCASASVPIVAYPGSSVALGRLCGRPFRVSVISVRSAGEADLKPLTGK